MKTRYTFNIILGAIIILLLSLLAGDQYVIKELKDLNEAQADTLITFRNENNQHVARISVLQTQSTQDFIDLETKDKEIQRLQGIVKNQKKRLKAGGSATVFTTNTIVNSTSETTITSSDTIVQDSIIHVYPTYHSSFSKGKWVFGTVESDRDSTKVWLKVHNEYSVVIGQDKQGFLGLGKPKPFSEVINHNIYSETRSLRTYQVSLPKPKKFGVGVFVGMDITGQPTVGGGFTYNFLRF